MYKRQIDGTLYGIWIASRLRRRGARRERPYLVRREHGYRRTRSEIRAHIERAGYRVGRVRYAAFGLVLARLPLPGGLLRLAAQLDRRFRVLNSATIFECLPMA